MEVFRLPEADRWLSISLSIHFVYELRIYGLPKASINEFIIEQKKSSITQKKEVRTRPLVISTTVICNIHSAREKERKAPKYLPTRLFNCTNVGY